MAIVKKIYHYWFAWLAYFYYGRPTKKLIVVGVTGTKGKSTACRLISSVLQAGGKKVGMMTTVEFQIAGRRMENKRKMTMLGRGGIQKMVKKMVKQGCQYAVIETSSEGILQYRHLGLNYDVAVFTNLGTEHSERHGGFMNLRKDKGKIFAALSRHKKTINGGKIKKVIVANGDDKNADYYLGFPADEKWSYGLTKPSAQGKELKAKILEEDGQGVKFSVGKTDFKINLIGRFNAYNALAAVAVGRSQNLSDEQIKKGLQSVDKVAGRMEFINEGQNFKLVVDYAHEPLSLTELFQTLRSLTAGRIIAVVGSDGGGRDKSKRKKMGQIAGKLADVVIISDVNPFDEDPRQIADMLAQGAKTAGRQEGKDLFIELDRKKAIKQAISLAEKGDIVAITAKGTEPCIVARGRKIPWDDRTVSRNLLKTINN